MLRKKNHVVRKKNHVVRKLFYVASPFTYRQPRRAGRRGKKDPAVEESSPAVEGFFHGIYFWCAAAAIFLKTMAGCLRALAVHWGVLGWLPQPTDGSRLPGLRLMPAAAVCRHARTASTFKCLTFAAFLTFIYFCNIFFTLLCHLANHMRHAYAARPLCAPHTATPCQHREG